ncbi:MAG: TrkA-C domain protein [Ilumatobacteraceae bacterium]|nr:TrkA-C domain protein [Ilumatobacteraceae bacterium]
MIAVASLLVVLTLALVVTRVATVSLEATGLSRDEARFQARSALSGVGFTTSEAEDVARHPVRRRIILVLMLLSGAGVVTTAASLVLSFVDTSGARQSPTRRTRAGRARHACSTLVHRCEVGSGGWGGFIRRPGSTAFGHGPVIGGSRRWVAGRGF